MIKQQVLSCSYCGEEITSFSITKGDLVVCFDCFYEAIQSTKTE